MWLNFFKSLCKLNANIYITDINLSKWNGANFALAEKSIRQIEITFHMIKCQVQYWPKVLIALCCFVLFFLRTLYWRISILPPASCVIMLITIISQFEDDGCYEIHRNKPLTCTQTNNRLDNINLWPSIIHAHTRKRYSKHTFNSYSYRKIPHFDTWWASLVYLLLLHIWNYRMAPTPKRTVFFFLFFFFSDNNAQ